LRIATNLPEPSNLDNVGVGNMLLCVRNN
jgi:hypothetical protein